MEAYVLHLTTFRYPCVALRSMHMKDIQRSHQEDKTHLYDTHGIHQSESVREEQLARFHGYKSCMPECGTDVIDHLAHLFQPPETSL